MIIQSPSICTLTASSSLVCLCYIFLPQSPGLSFSLLSLSISIPIDLTQFLISFQVCISGSIILSPQRLGFLSTTWIEETWIALNSQRLAHIVPWHFKCCLWLIKAWYSPINWKTSIWIQDKPQAVKLQLYPSVCCLTYGCFTMNSSKSNIAVTLVHLKTSHRW